MSVSAWQSATLLPMIYKWVQPVEVGGRARLPSGDVMNNLPFPQDAPRQYGKVGCQNW